MRVEYKKEWMETYLWVLPDKQSEDAYIELMLKHNPGDGRLEFSKQEKEGETYFCYKITGKKALNSIYAVMPVGERQIRGILCQLLEILEAGKECLLCEDDFVLAPQYIFATFPQMKIELCYVPGYGVPLKEQLEGVFEYLLNRVDYDDKQAVNLLYDCYMFCMKESGGLKEIKKLLEKDKKQEEFPVPMAETKEPDPVKTECVISKTEGRKKKTEVEQPAISKVSYLPKEEQEKDMSYVAWLTGHLLPWWKKETAMVAEERPVYGAHSAKGKRKNKKAKEKNPEEEQRTEIFLKGKGENRDTENSGQTVLLSTRTESEVPELICEKTGEVIPLGKFPFYIGSAQEYCDYVLSLEGVSRIHCCISKKQEKYYLSDLNSTNGTLLNQKELVPGNKEVLSERDEIKIVSADFYVKFPCH